MALFKYSLEKLTLLLGKPNSGCLCVCVQLVPVEARKGLDPMELELDVCKLPHGAGSQMGPVRELYLYQL